MLVARNKRPRKLEATKVLLALPWADADRRQLISER
jgi:hypothetical protein